MALEQRKRMRLKNYNYSENGLYFITICTTDKINLLSEIYSESDISKIHLSKIGKIIEEELLAVQQRYTGVFIDKYAIMPNHIHAIIRIENTGGASPTPTLSDIICAFKSLSAKRCKPLDKIFQRSFYDHIIRNNDDYKSVWQYIDTNPCKWEGCY